MKIYYYQQNIVARHFEIFYIFQPLSQALSALFFVQQGSLHVKENLWFMMNISAEGYRLSTIRRIDIDFITKLTSSSRIHKSDINCIYIELERLF